MNASQESQGTRAGCLVAPGQAPLGVRATGVCRCEELEVSRTLGGRLDAGGVESGVWAFGGTGKRYVSNYHSIMFYNC